MSESMPDRNVASSDAADVVIDTATLRPDEKQFLEEHSLKKPMGTAQIWALGVGAVITGEYFGWNGGLGVAGSCHGKRVYSCVRAFWPRKFSRSNRSRHEMDTAHRMRRSRPRD